MTNSLSKFRLFSGIHNNCYETIHTWNPSCTGAFADIAIACVRGALKVYLPLYLAPHFVARNFSAAALQNTALKLAKSLAVVTANTSLIVGFSCLIMHVTGKVHYLTPFWGSILAHFFSFIHERESRKNALSMFSTKSCFEILFKYAVDNGHIVHFPEQHAAVILFAASIAVNFYLARKYGFSRDPLSQILAWLVGRQEGAQKNTPHAKADDDVAPLDHGADEGENETGTKTARSGKTTTTAAAKGANNAQERPGAHSARVTQWNANDEGAHKCVQRDDARGILSPAVKNVDRRPIGSHRGPWCCPHSNNCVRYAASGLVRPFLVGWLGQAALAALKHKSLDPRVLIADENALRFGLFLGGMASAFRACRCAMRRLTGRDDESQALVSGFTSALALGLYPSTQIALYTFWKTMYTLYWLRFGHAKKQAQLFLDATFFVLDSILINCTIMEPQYVARSYLKFVSSVTDGHLRTVNVALYNQLTGRTNEWYYGDKVQNLCADHCSKRYLETTASWLLENKHSFHRPT